MEKDDVPTLEMLLKAIEPHRCNPRVAKDVAAIDRHLKRMEAALLPSRRTLTNSVDREQRYAFERARRVVEQRSRIVLKKLGLGLPTDSEVS